MSRQSELNLYIRQVQQRLRLSAGLRGVALLMAAALIMTVVLVLVLNAYAFPLDGLTGARIVLLVVLAAVAAVALVVPVLKLNWRRSVAAAEKARPELEQRLTTFSERDKAGSDPFIELLAADTLTVAQTADASPLSLIPQGRLMALAGAGLGCLAVLVWIVAAAPGYIGYGASLLWTGPKKDVAPLYEIRVLPGDIAVRRHSDQLITAEVIGLKTEKVRLFASYRGEGSEKPGGWEPVAMTAMPLNAGIVQSDVGSPSRGANFQFVFAGLPESVEYYVEAGPVTSKHYKVRVVDLPSVQQIQVTYRYPKWTGLREVAEEHGGDLRAIEGTEAEIEVTMDRTLKDGVLSLDDGQQLKLAGDGTRYRGTIKMTKDGAYHVAAMDQGQQVRLSEDYFIATNKANPPEIRIDRPTGDYRASPIEEVTVAVNASDEFGLNQVELHYSVNGAAEQKMSLLKAPGTKNADGTMTLHLEDFKLVPGDLVSLYATAKDGHQESRTDMAFIQAEPYEREFSQSQQSGGGGGGGGGQQGSQTDISKREKELIAATWRQVNGQDQNGRPLGKPATAKELTDAGKFLSEVQVKLREQVTALSGRMQSRDLATANEEFTAFEKDMQAAAAAMTPSAEKLKGMQWKDALPMEQKALQYLLRAEATFRQIQVAFGQQRGGGAGGGGSAGRDLASLFDLELDTEKNQYETAQTASPAEQKAKEVDDALAKLDALARRQEELAQKPQNSAQNSAQSFEQRWQQEMLRREAERLEKQMQQMAQNGQQGAQGSQGQPGSQGSSADQASKQSSGQSSSQQGSQGNSGAGQGSKAPSAGQQGKEKAGQPGQSGQSDPRVIQALNRLRQADEAMKQGASAGPQSADAARRAAEALRQATNLLGGTQQQQATGKLDSLTREADRLGKEERSQAERIKSLSSRSGSDGSATGELTPEQVGSRVAERNRLAEERQRLSDDLSQLEKGMRDSARSLAPNQPNAAGKVRDALNGMDQADLGNKVQRTADWLRRGIDPNSNGTEAGIGTGLQKLEEQLKAAQQGMGTSQPGDRQGQGQGQGRDAGRQTAELDHVDRLRNQLETLAASNRSGQGQPGQPNQDRTGRGRPTQGGNVQGRQGTSQGQQVGQDRQGQGQQGQNTQQAQGGQGQGGGRQGHPGSSNPQAGAVRRGGEDLAGRRGGGDGSVDYSIDTGNQRFDQSGKRVVDGPQNRGGQPGISAGEQAYRNGLAELNQLRQLANNDPASLKEIQSLIREMQQLDPARFVGNPALVEQLHAEVLHNVNTLELHLRRAEDQQTGQVRTAKPATVQAGYQDQVAEYYRRLSRTSGAVIRNP